MADQNELHDENRGEEDRAILATGYRQLRKADLETLLKKLHLDHTGNVGTMRARLADHLNQPDPAPEDMEDEEGEADGEEQEGQDEDTRDTQDDETEYTDPEPSILRDTEINTGRQRHNTTATVGICEQIRKSGITFDGRTDPVLFLERLDEFQECYNLPRHHLLVALPVMLRGNALLWYRNARDGWCSFDDFLKDFHLQFLPPRYQYHLEEEVRRRVQGRSEKFKDYAVALQTLLRRAAFRSPEEKLERIYNNMLPNYKLYVRRGTVSTVSELMAAAIEYEQILEDEKGTCSTAGGQNRIYPPSGSSGPRMPVRSANVPAAPRNTRQPPVASAPRKIEIHADTCWRCGQRGHSRSRCQNRAVAFCSRCGKTGVLTKDCCGFQGN